MLYVMFSCSSVNVLSTTSENLGIIFFMLFLDDFSDLLLYYKREIFSFKLLTIFLFIVWSFSELLFATTLNLIESFGISTFSSLFSDSIVTKIVKIMIAFFTKIPHFQLYSEELDIFLFKIFKNKYHSIFS